MFDTLYAQFQRVVQAHPDAVALELPDGLLSYAELHRHSDAVAQYLCDSNIKAMVKADYLSDQIYKTRLWSAFPSIAVISGQIIAKTSTSFAQEGIAVLRKLQGLSFTAPVNA